ncbi:uncharacterized protein MYCFIDRAFT_209463 [Pseudocercospora fijiensis CIRAD86]|uniref:Glutathione S-transferase n=1 Tax=Pseudocercospora fijiensis (strain CIRAD86) TaxID=383855 RepID=N1Q706_PSEFD|nr:uncharacterized protein MYCFIDRAFT_209463 [Pseudocercospora fijiensis CIRAD86]EME87271.1 hypothetical protein MYCFIDRAFT_209463 [Pseudocercospora fijiensis CIRAD86]
MSSSRLLTRQSVATHYLFHPRLATKHIRTASNNIRLARNRLPGIKDSPAGIRSFASSSGKLYATLSKTPIFVLQAKPRGVEMADQPAKKLRTSHPTYELLYHPGIPGRGEFIRLAFEAAGVPYTDIANEDHKNGYAEVQQVCMNDGIESSDGNPPVFSPPALRVRDGEKALVISQTPNILIYLGEKLGLVPAGDEKFYVQQLALTALDLNNEIHDTHHPIAASKYYEDQKDAALEKAKDLRATRIPKFFKYFERQLKWNSSAGQHKYLVGDRLTYADLTVWQILDGAKYAFPKELEVRRKEFPELLGTFYESVKEEEGIKEYLASERRLKYSMGVFRYYPELDRP